MSEPNALRPTGKDWRYIGPIAIPHGGRAEGWRNAETGVRCLSAVEVVEQNPPGSGLHVPHFHVSATHAVVVGPRLVRRACTDQEIESVRAAFGIGGAEEDNHGPGIARHLWIVCGREKEPECPCKQDEERIVEGPRVRHEPAPAPPDARAGEEETQ